MFFIGSTGWIFDETLETPLINAVSETGAFPLLKYIKGKYTAKSFPASSSLKESSISTFLMPSKSRTDLWVNWSWLKVSG